MKQTLGERSALPLKGALTIDLEDWRGSLTPTRGGNWRQRPPIDETDIREKTRSLLFSLDQLNTKATFFVVGELINRIPEILKEISRAGHEVGSHSPVHVSVNTIPREEYSRMLERDAAAIEETTGHRPKGFRAPYFSVSRSDGWLFRTLHDLGFSYDSSVFPSWTPLYGLPMAHRLPYFPSMEDISKSVSRGPILEVPITVWPSRGRVIGFPIGGGFFAGVWPTKIYLALLNRVADTGQPIVLYAHLNDFYGPSGDGTRLRIRDRMIHSFGTERRHLVFDAVMKEHKLGTIQEVFRKELDGLDDVRK